jgi:hypothetical protein
VKSSQISFIRADAIAAYPSSYHDAVGLPPLGVADAHLGSCGQDCNYGKWMKMRPVSSMGLLAKPQGGRNRQKCNKAFRAPEMTRDL